MPNITPFLFFNNKAEEAAKYYVTIFENSHIDDISRYGEHGPVPAGTAMVVEFTLDGKEFMALNGGETESPAANIAPGAIALFVNCETQAKVDGLWEKLSEGGEKLQCGWVRDRYGVAWNIVPAGFVDYVRGPDPEKAARAMQAMLKMQKLDLNEVRNAYENSLT